VFVNYIICSIVSIDMCVHFVITRQKDVLKRMLKDAPCKSVDTAYGCKYTVPDVSFCVVDVHMFHVFQDVRYEYIFRILFQLLIMIVSFPTMLIV
jgi:hypothetical protein